MKNSKISSKVVVILLTLTMSVFLFAACNKSTASSQNSGQNSTGRRQFNKDAMKQRYQNSLQALVKDGTITQDQSNKILDTLTANIDNMGRGGRRPNNQGNNQNNGGQNNNGYNQTSRSRNNPLGKLVSDKVITQDQADKVMNALRPNRQNQNNTSNSNGTSN